MSSQEPQPLEPRDYRIVLITQLIFFPMIWLGQVVTGGLDGGSGPRDILFFTLLVWICVALGFWAGLGTQRGRLAIIAVVSPLIGVLAASPMDLTEWVEFQVFCLGIILVVAIPCFGLRLTIGPLTAADEVAEEKAAAGAVIQFGINHVLLWTLVTAILFQVARWLSSHERLSNLGTLLMVLAYSASTSANILFFIWAILGTRQVDLEVGVGNFGHHGDAHRELLDRPDMAFLAHQCDRHGVVCAHTLAAQETGIATGQGETDRQRQGDSVTPISIFRFVFGCLGNGRIFGGAFA